jgi:hypothetical protein
MQKRARSNPSLRCETDTPARRPSVRRVLQELRPSLTPSNGRPSKENNERGQVASEKPAGRPTGPAAPSAGTPSRATAPNPQDDANFARLMKALGSNDPDFVTGLFQQILEASAKNHGVLFTLAVAKSTAPKDELEVMQLTQMAAVHAAMMRATGELARAETVMHQEVATRAVNQLARTYTAQLEALKRYRAGAEPAVAVQNVSVSQGAQAIVTQGSPRALPQDVANATAALTDARQTPMEIIEEPQRAPVLRRAKRPAARLSGSDQSRTGLRDATDVLSDPKMTY